MDDGAVLWFQVEYHFIAMMEQLGYTLTYICKTLLGVILCQVYWF